MKLELHNRVYDVMKWLALIALPALGVLYGALAGAAYSWMMDVWTVLWADGYFNISRYIAAVISAVQFTVVYAVSNVVFLLIFEKPIGKVLERVKKKYLL